MVINIIIIIIVNVMYSRPAAFSVPPVQLQAEMCNEENGFSDFALCICVSIYSH